MGGVVGSWGRRGTKQKEEKEGKEKKEFDWVEEEEEEVLELSSQLDKTFFYSFDNIKSFPSPTLVGKNIFL